MDALGPVFLGILISVLGIKNIKGNINTLHRYHRSRVAEADMKPFGKLVGTGTLIMGIAIAVYGAINILAEKLANEYLQLAGTIILVIALVVGLGMSFYAMIKYNK